MLRKKRGLIVALCCLLSYPFMAQAGFNEAMSALQSKNFPTALKEARQAADSGDARGYYLLGAIYQNGLGVPANTSEAAAWYEKAAQERVVGAFAKLAQLYLRGDGVEKNPDKALELARKSDQMGDPEGSLFVYVILNGGPLSQLGANGKPDQVKYQKLAARPVAERNLDVEAKDALYRSAAKGYPLAQLMLALNFGGIVGDDNRERMLALASKIPNHTYQALKNYEQIARHMQTLGQTYTSPQLFYDAQPSQMLAGMVKTCGIRDPKDVSKQPPPQLTAMAISKPLSNAVYLPSTVPGNEHAFLVSGEWEESWTYRACDKTANVIVKFTADGMGGAAFVSSQQAAKPDSAVPAAKL